MEQHSDIRIIRRRPPPDHVSFDVLDWMHSTGVFDKIRESGEEIIAACPFAAKTHQSGMDQNPSWFINRNTGLWYCHACKERGNVYHLMERMSLSSITLEKVDVDKEFDRLKEGLYPVKPPEYEKIPYWPMPPWEPLYVDETWKDSQALKWLMQKTPITKKSILEFGIVRDVETGGVLFPITDSQGYQIAWQLRQWGTPPYLFPKEKFKKSHHLYNIKAINKRDDVIVVEGVKAVIFLHQNGVKAVSTFGSTLSTEQFRLLLRCKSLTIMYDSDLAGDIAVKALTTTMSRFRGELRVAKLPPPSDPNKTSPDDYPWTVVHKSLDEAKVKFSPTR